MNSNTIRKSLAVIASALLLFGCNKNNPVDSTSADMSDVYDDAAYTISGAVGDESGGATESYGDLLTVQSVGKLNASLSLAKGESETVSSDSGTYDPATGWWTVNITRTRSNLRVTASITRNYQFRFWKNDAEFQPFYITNGDTATKMEFTIVGGSGYFKNPHVTHHLTHIEGSWLATNIDKDTVTITLQQNYIRQGVDSVVTLRKSRVFDHTLTLTAANVTTVRYKPNGPRTFYEWRQNLSHAVSGTVSGHLTATITVTKGDSDNIRSIDKDFTVTVGGGEGSIRINGADAGYSCDLEYGDR